MTNSKMKIAILDDYQGIALKMADWSLIPGNPEITVFKDHVAELDKIVQRLLPYDILCIMRERTPITSELIERLPNLKLIASTGKRNLSIDLEAANRRGITVLHTNYESAPTIEFTWSMILAIVRNIAIENASLRGGGWQTSVGGDLKGKTLGVLGLGNIGAPVAAIGKAFGMNIISWSPNMTMEKAQLSGARYVSKEELFRQSDILTIHIILSNSTRGIVGEADLNLMKPTAYFINTSRGPLVDEAALIRTLQNKKIAGAAIDVFEIEPLPANHPFRSLPNVLATPHLGYGSKSLYEIFYRDSVENIRKWISENQYNTSS
jgi:phosphoglycerate dehydrogenase-like enzyme